MTLVDRSDVAPGDFDIQFTYNGLQWDTGDASGGKDGLANTDGNPAYPARAGYSNGTGDAGTYFELSGSGAPGGLLGLSGTHTYEVRNPTVSLTAYRTGGNYGEAVSDADLASADPSNYVNLVDDGYTLDPTGNQDDLDYNSSLIAQDEPVDLSNQNLAQITLHPVQFPGSGGTCYLVLSNPASARLYDSSGHPLTDGTSATQMIAVDGFDGDVGVYVEGLQADPDFSLTYELVGSGGDVVASTSVHMAIADISLVDDNDTNLTFLPVDEDLPDMLDSAMSPGIKYSVVGDLDVDEYKTSIDGIHSDQIQQVIVSSDSGDQYQDSMTDTEDGAQSSLYAISVDNSGQSLTAAQHSQILSAFDINAIDPPSNETIELKTKKDDQTRKIANDPTAMSFAYPFNQTADNHLDAGGKPIPLVTSSVAVSSGKLSVTIRDADDWTNQSDTGPAGYDMLKVFTGDSKAADGDTDSGQFAVVWTDANGNVVGQYTNAHAQGERTSAADWVSNGYTGKTPKGKGERAVTNNTAEVPAGAVNVNIVLLFTDILRGPRNATANVKTNGHGDLPAIIGSWSGKFENGKWLFTKNQADVDIIPQIKDGWPTAAQVWGRWYSGEWGGWNGDIKSKVEEWTKGVYTLSIRDSASKNNNVTKSGQRNDFDSGFDIVPKN